MPRNWGFRLMLSKIPFGQCFCSFLSVLNANVRFQKTLDDFQVLESELVFCLRSAGFVLYKSFFLHNPACKAKYNFGSCSIFFIPPKSFVGGLLHLCIFQFLLGICQSSWTRARSAVLSRYGLSGQRQDNIKRSSNFQSTSLNA